MLFNSYVFIFGFLPITLTIFFQLHRFRLSQVAIIFLTIASLFFYGYWNLNHLYLLIFSIISNYFFGKYIKKFNDKNRLKKLIFILGISFNLVIIGYFKYIDFFAHSWSYIIQSEWDSLSIILPLGISFYTFTQIAYLVDIYQGKVINKDYSFLTFTLFISFFPQLIAGPILRHNEIIPQFSRLKDFTLSYKNLMLGLFLFILGLAKKILIADKLALWISPIFDNSNTITFIESWVGALGYTFQLYFDFSGYSDMAIGLGLMFNLTLPINFNSPYKSLSIIEFWRRWHITLSNFLRDYLYIPLGGNRLGETRRYLNLLMTMLLGGLWHGAGWTFVLWGGIQGISLSMNHAWNKLNISLPKFLCWVITFITTVFSWVLFRSLSLENAISFWKTMLGINGIYLTEKYAVVFPWLVRFGIQFQENFPYLDAPITKVIYVLMLLFCVCFLPNSQEIMSFFKPNLIWLTISVILTSYCLLSLNQVSEFIYFQF